MRIALSTYSMDRRMGEGTLNQLTCIAKAKELGFDAIEFVEIFPHDGSTPEDYAKKLREECERVGMPVSSLMVGADFLRCADLPAEIARVQHLAEIAAILGAPKMRHDATAGFPDGERANRGFDDCLPLLADACLQVTRFAKDLGVRTMVENHGWFCQDSARLEKLANAVRDENFGLLCDMGNFMDADEDPIEALHDPRPRQGFPLEIRRSHRPGLGLLADAGREFPPRRHRRARGRPGEAVPVHPEGRGL